jgi:4-amino-4-deoxy-L-arabinose transferase-like glycosyltransferase
MQPAAQRPVAREALVVALLALALLLPFTGKAWHIDDTLFLWAAEHIHDQPLDFYGFNKNWYGVERPMHATNMNPPLTAYWIAAATALAGWHEQALHLAFLPWAAGAALGAWFTARLLTARPLAATLAAVVTPAFLVSSTNVMTDTPMTCLYLWAIGLWVYGLERGRSRWLFLAGALAALGFLTKFFAISAVPLLAAYALAHRRRWSAWPLALVLPVAVAAAYELVFIRMYGHPHFLASFAYSGAAQQQEGAPLLARTLIGLAFLGGACAVGLFLTPAAGRFRDLAAAGGVALFAALYVRLRGQIGLLPVVSDTGVTWAYIVQFALWTGVGAWLLMVTGREVWRRRDAGAVLLTLWVAGTFVFATYVNWTTSVRNLLPLAPAVTIVLARATERLNPPRWAPAAAIAAAALLGLAVTAADYSWANANRTLAHRIAADFDDREVWFQGHWGFQRYMEQHGFPAVDVFEPAASAGALLALPVFNTNVFPPDPRYALRVAVVTEPVLPWLATGRIPLGAGFYTSATGALPFVFGAVPAERVDLYQVRPAR